MLGIEWQAELRGEIGDIRLVAVRCLGAEAVMNMCNAEIEVQRRPKRVEAAEKAQRIGAARYRHDNTAPRWKQALLPAERQHAAFDRACRRIRTRRNPG